ncbi:lipoprotein insertase outer membrane protein LolB [Luteimonas terricola]|uniref:Outer-membrane lipoprotein LolB n=1 Tax=Luteimonas terricola TaxID=645597 RepID=A0ABQ2EB18_9GAMM|nr:lipoprotein insertase outer membrane protein LolB [Luteimonas terricola]GGK00588.1 outer-membrane lipoprotein LolB [Luteimonas terricola]
MTLLRFLFTLACAGALAACATRPLPPVAPPLLDAADRARAEALQAERAQALATMPAWSLTGRAAITRSGKGGSGRIEWHQDGGAFEVALAAPVTRQSWRLAVDSAGARLEGLEGGVRTGPDGQALLFEATGLEVPVDALGAWLRGLPADEAVHGTAQLAFGEDLLPLRLEQAGWSIDFRAWRAAGDGRPGLPLRIDARRGDAGVRLVVDAWGGTER